MSPRALDPLFRARNFPREPSPRRQVRSTESRVRSLEKRVSVVASVATQPDALTIQGTTYVLPPVTLDDIGRQITVQSTSGVGTQVYIGVLNAFGVPQWLLFSSNDTSGSGSGGTIGGSTFTADHAWASLISGGPRNVAAASDGQLFITADNQAVNRFNPATGGATFVSIGFPPSTSIRGVSARTTSAGDVYVAGRSAKKLYRWNSGTSAVVTSADTQTFVAVRYSAVDAAIYAAYGVSGAAGAVAKYNQNTLAFVSNVFTWTAGTSFVIIGLAIESSSGDLITTRVSTTGAYYLVRNTSANGFVWGGARAEMVSPKGVATDGSFIYVADSGANKIHVYLFSTGVYQGSFGSSGSALDQLSSPQDVAVSGANIYVADFGNTRITRWIKS